MKVEHLLAQYLYNNKTVSLQDIGIFTLSPSVAIPTDSDRETQLPEGSIEFTYDPKAKQDEGLVDFIVLQTRKIKPLAASDLESYSILGRQFLNIGKPFPIEGLGTLQKSDDGLYEFVQGHTVNARLEAPASALREKKQEDIDFSSQDRNTGSSKKTGLIIAVVLFVIIAAAALYYYQSVKETSPVASTQPVKDTPVNIAAMPPVTDTVRRDSVVNTAPADGSSFHVVVRDYASKAAAEKSALRFRTFGYDLKIDSVDQTHFNLYMPFTLPLTDTLRVKDSLIRIFGKNTTIRLR